MSINETNGGKVDVHEKALQMWFISATFNLPIHPQNQFELPGSTIYPSRHFMDDESVSSPAKRTVNHAATISVISAPRADGDSHVTKDLEESPELASSCLYYT